MSVHFLVFIESDSQPVVRNTLEDAKTLGEDHAKLGRQVRIESYSATYPSNVWRWDHEIFAWLEG